MEHSVALAVSQGLAVPEKAEQLTRYEKHVNRQLHFGFKYAQLHPTTTAESDFYRFVWSKCKYRDLKAITQLKGLIVTYRAGGN